MPQSKVRIAQNDFIYFGVSLFLSLLLIFLDSKSSLGFLKGNLQIIISPVTSTLYHLKPKGFDMFSSQLTQKDKEISDLAIQNANLAAQLSQLKDLEEENKESRRLLGTDLPPSWQFSPAKVITKNADTITILTDEKAQMGQVVILPRDESFPSVVSQYGIYLGKVDEVDGVTLRVILPTSTLSKIAVDIRDKDTFEKKASGILVGRGSRSLLDQVLNSENLAEGDWVLSTDEGDLGSHSDLLIGKIEKVLQGSNTTFKQADVNLIIDNTKIDRAFLVNKRN